MDPYRRSGNLTFYGHIQDTTMNMSNPNDPPGIWASVITRLDWPMARQDDGIELASGFLIYRSQFRATREPIFRPCTIPPQILIGSSLRMTEAARLHISSYIVPVPCAFCAGGNGPFAQCVTLQRWDGPCQCSNCHSQVTNIRVSWPIQSCPSGITEGPMTSRSFSGVVTFCGFRRKKRSWRSLFSWGFAVFKSMADHLSGDDDQTWQIQGVKSAKRFENDQ